jgi:hypothetical protein
MSSFLSMLDRRLERLFALLSTSTLTKRRER